MNINTRKLIILLLPECTTWNHHNIGCAGLLLDLGKKSLDHCRPSQSLYVPPGGLYATFIAHVSAKDSELMIFGQSFQVAVALIWTMQLVVFIKNIVNK